MALETGDIDSVLRQLRRASRVTEIAQVTSYVGYLAPSGRAPVQVTISVHDHGPAAGPERWVVLVADELGNETMGNPEASLETAIDVVHWSEIGREQA